MGNYTRTLLIIAALLAPVLVLALRAQSLEPKLTAVPAQLPPIDSSASYAPSPEDDGQPLDGEETTQGN